MKNKDVTKKTALMAFKDFISVSDCRSLLALIITVGGLLVIALSVTTGDKDLVTFMTPSMSALIMLVLNWYFKDKKDAE